MFSRPKILFLVSLLFVALLNPKFNPYLPFKFLIFYHSSIIILYIARRLRGNLWSMPIPSTMVHRKQEPGIPGIEAKTNPSQSLVVAQILTITIRLCRLTLSITVYLYPLSIYHIGLAAFCFVFLSLLSAKLGGSVTKQICRRNLKFGFKFPRISNFSEFQISNINFNFIL